MTLNNNHLLTQMTSNNVYNKIWHLKIVRTDTKKMQNIGLVTVSVDLGWSAIVIFKDSKDIQLINFNQMTELFFIYTGFLSGYFFANFFTVNQKNKAV